MPPKFSPLVFNRVSEAGGSYESLNIALQAHTRHPSYTPDRFLVYSRVRHVGDDAFEVVQAWINNSYVADPVKRLPRTSLDHFNFPWLITRQQATPFVIANLRGELWDLSDKRWPPKRGDVLRDGQWFGGFAGPDASAPGYIVTLANDRRTRLRLGAVDKRVVTNVTNDRSKFQFARQRAFVFGAIRTDVQATPGDIVVAKYYLLFGPRNRIEPKADRFFKSSYVKRLRLPAAMAEQDLIGFCGTSGGGLVDCPESKQPRFWLTRTICSECAPLYELQDVGTGRLVYSSDPYLGYKAGTPLTKLRYTPRRILGWLPNQNAKAPRGFRLVSVAERDPLGIHIHPKDKGSAYLRRSN